MCVRSPSLTIVTCSRPSALPLRLGSRGPLVAVRLTLMGAKGVLGVRLDDPTSQSRVDWLTAGSIKTKMASLMLKSSSRRSAQ